MAGTIRLHGKESPLKSKSRDPQDHIVRRIQELQSALQGADPARLAHQTGTEFVLEADGKQVFHFLFWNRPVRMHLPEWIIREAESGEPLPASFQALCLFYFTTANSAPRSGKWVSFSELPDGRFYNQAYQGYSGGELLRAFGDDLDVFRSAAERSGGKPLNAGETEIPGDLAYRFQMLPRVELLVTVWAGDEDFPSSYQILFDASVSNYLPTDVCAIAGGMLAGRLMRSR